MSVAIKQLLHDAEVAGYRVRASTFRASITTPDCRVSIRISPEGSYQEAAASRPLGDDRDVPERFRRVKDVRDFLRLG